MEMDQAVLFSILILAVIVMGAGGGFFTIKTSEVGIIARFGRFVRVAQPGLGMKWPFIETVAGRITLRVMKIDLQMETKTKDNVFVTIPLSVQTRVNPERVYDAFYKLSDPQAQIEAYVEQVILGHVPTMTLDDLFAQQANIALAVKAELDGDMAEFGYEIVNVLVTDIVPDAKVKAAMNDINAAERARIAAQARGEAEKILEVKKAEAQAQSKALQGKGIADERTAIIQGLKTSLEDLKQAVSGVNDTEVMQLLMMTQYFDMLKAIGESGKSNTLFVSHAPGNLADIRDQIMQSVIGAEKTG